MASLRCRLERVMIMLIVPDEHLLMVLLGDGHHARLALVQTGSGARPIRACRGDLVLGEGERAHLQLATAAESLDEREILGYTARIERRTIIGINTGVNWMG